MDKIEKINLRPYQELAVNDLLTSINNKVNTILQLPTGTGKTTVIAELIRRWKRENPNARTLILVHRIELIDQVVTRLFDFGIVAGRIKSGEQLDPNFQIQVGLVQSLKNDKRKPITMELIIVDEAHHITSKSYQEIIQYYDNFKPVILGVTATPSRLDGAPLGSSFKSLLQYGQLMNFVKDGYLASMRHFATGAPELSEVQVKNTGDYDEKMLYTAMNSELVMADIIMGYELHAKNKKTIVFAVNTEHAQNIAKRFNERGYIAVALDYKTNAQTRKEMVEKFKKGEIQILCNVNLFTEGFDCPDVEVVQLARPTKSLNLYLQMIGRGMRVYPGKQHGIILDNAKLWEEHGLYSRERYWDLNGFKKGECIFRIIQKVERDSDKDNPTESDYLELIEIVDEAFSKIQGQDSTLNILVFPFLLLDLNKALEIYRSLNIKTMNLRPFQQEFKNFITGQKLSARSVLNMIDSSICREQESISTNKFIQIINNYAAKFNKNDKAFQLVLYQVISWHENSKVFENALRKSGQEGSLIRLISTLIRDKNVLNALNLEKEFIFTIGELITKEQLEHIYESIQEKYYDCVYNEIKKINNM